MTFIIILFYICIVHFMLVAHFVLMIRFYMTLKIFKHSLFIQKIFIELLVCEDNLTMFLHFCNNCFESSLLPSHPQPPLHTPSSPAAPPAPPGVSGSTSLREEKLSGGNLFNFLPLKKPSSICLLITLLPSCDSGEGVLK